MKAMPTTEFSPTLGSDSQEPGRCVYCGERCNGDAIWHQYCRLECEYEERHGLDKIRPKKRSMSMGKPD